MQWKGAAVVTAVAVVAAIVAAATAATVAAAFGKEKRRNESKREQVTVPRCSTRGVVAKKGRKRVHKTKQREDTEEK